MSANQAKMLCMGAFEAKFVIPKELLPEDGRFGCGPSRVRESVMAGLATCAVGTEAAIATELDRYKQGLTVLYDLPPNWEILVGSGGSSCFWDAAAQGLIENRSQHLVFDAFSRKFAECVARVPLLEPPEVLESEYGTLPQQRANPEVDAYAWPHNATSTGIAANLKRPAESGLTIVDGTSAGAAIRAELAELDVYYFSLAKGFSSDGGIWVALCSPGAIERIESIGATGRYIPQSISLEKALGDARARVVPSDLAALTLFMAAEQTEWLNSQGGMEWAAARCEKSAGIMYRWAEASDYAVPFVANPLERSPVTAVIEIDPTIDARFIIHSLRKNGIVGIEPYRGIGKNPIRVGLFPSIKPDDVEALTRCVDYAAQYAPARSK